MIYFKSMKNTEVCDLYDFMKDIETIELKEIANNNKTKKIYSFSINKFRYIIDTPKVFSPFGIENYKNKFIINIELDPNNNECYNFINKMREIDDMLRGDEHFNGKTYKPILKKRDDRYLIRTHLNVNRKIDEIKQKNIKVKLFFDNLWEEEHTYGVKIQIKNIDVV